MFIFRTKFKDILTKQKMKFLMEHGVTSVENRQGGGHIVNVKNAKTNETSQVRNNLVVVNI